METNLSVDTEHVKQLSSGREVADIIVALIGESIADLSDVSKEAFWLKLKKIVNANCPDLVIATSPENKELLERVIKQCDLIIRFAKEVPDNPDAQKFAASISMKAESVRNHVEKQCRVSAAQRTMLDNMESGIRAWHRELLDE